MAIATFPVAVFFLCFSSVNTLIMSSNPSQPKRVAVIGTTGRLGRTAIAQLSSKGIETRCLLRHPIANLPNDPVVAQAQSQMSYSSDSPAKPKTSAEIASELSTLPGVTMVQGDVNDRSSLIRLLHGCDAVLALHGSSRRFKPADLLSPLGITSNPELDPAHPKNTNYEGVRNIIKAAKEEPRCKRIVRITGKGEAPFSFVSVALNGLGCMAKAWNYEGEQLLREAASNGDIDYTIIRPGVMKSDYDAREKKVLALADNGGDLKVSPVSYEQIAALCCRSLEYDNAACTTLCAMNVDEGEGEADYGPLLASVKPDRRVFKDSYMDESRLAVKIGGLLLSGIVFGIAMGFFSALRLAMGLVIS